MVAHRIGGDRRDRKTCQGGDAWAGERWPVVLGDQRGRPRREGFLPSLPLIGCESTRVGPCRPPLPTRPCRGRASNPEEEEAPRVGKGWDAGGAVTEDRRRPTGGDGSLAWRRCHLDQGTADRERTELFYIVPGPLPASLISSRGSSWDGRCCLSPSQHETEWGCG